MSMEASHEELRTISRRSGDGSRMRVACSMLTLTVGVDRLS